MGTILAVANAKGGTGKTTVAVNVACALERRNIVTLVDADPQMAACAWCADGAAAIRARRHLMGSGDGPDDVDETTCRRWIEAVQLAAREVDYLVIDMPPRLSTVVATSFALAHTVLVPVTPGGAEMRATRRTVGMIRRARRSRDNVLPDCVLVPNRVDRRTAVGRALEHDLRELGEGVGPTLRQRAAHMTSFDAGTWVGAHAPQSEAFGEIAALVTFLRRRLGHAPGRTPAGGPGEHRHNPAATG